MTGSRSQLDIPNLTSLQTTTAMNNNDYDLLERPLHPTSSHDDTAREFYKHSKGQRIATDAVIAQSIRRQYPELQLTIVPQTTCNLLAYAAAGFAQITPIEDPEDPLSAPLKWRQYIPPTRRLDGEIGVLVDQIQYGKYLYRWNNQDLIVYIVNGRDGVSSYPMIINQYILTSLPVHITDTLVLESSKWSIELHDEVWVFDAGYWQKSAELYRSVQSSRWEDVILDKEMKESIVHDVMNFYDSRETYAKLKVPWKRGVIYYGPPGNGKTISIKAMMHSLYNLKIPIPTLYVRSLVSYGGPQYALRLIFEKARQTAPCYLVFEDLDSLVNDQVRSYFLNEVDGLQNNDGIFMIGSTNHLERLDPGISKRPSRFDRKYLFPNPDHDQRVAYCHYWQGKLSNNDDIEFPDELCNAIADITDKFSFAYMQEAFVASLLAIAARDKRTTTTTTTRGNNISFSKLRGGGDEDIENNEFWKELKKQIKILREGLEDSDGEASTAMENNFGRMHIGR